MLALTTEASRRAVVNLIARSRLHAPMIARAMAHRLSACAHTSAGCQHHGQRPERLECDFGHDGGAGRHGGIRASSSLPNPELDVSSRNTEVLAQLQNFEIGLEPSWPRPHRTAYA